MGGVDEDVREDTAAEEDEDDILVMNLLLLGSPHKPAVHHQNTQVCRCVPIGAASCMRACVFTPHTPFAGLALPVSVHHIQDHIAQESEGHTVSDPSVRLILCDIRSRVMHDTLQVSRHWATLFTSGPK